LRSSELVARLREAAKTDFGQSRPAAKLAPVAKAPAPAPTPGPAPEKDRSRFDQRQSPNRKKLSQILKVGSAVALLAVGIGTVLVDQTRVSSNNAVVSTYLISIRAPIDGTVSGLPGGVGATLSAGQRLAHLENPRVDDQRLVDLREQMSRLKAQREAAEVNRATLTALRAELNQRVAFHTKINAERLSGLKTEAEKTLAALAAKQAQAQAEVDRRLPLEASQSVAPAEMQRLRAVVESARQESAAQANRVASIRAEADAARNGVLAGPGGIDVTYSAQRADEIAITLSNLNQTIAQFVAQSNETQARLASEEQRIALMRTAELVTPASGMIWKVGAGNGERLSVGEPAAEIVDCSAAFLLVAIPQDRFSEVEIGSLAQFRLSGERTERTGRVLSIAAQGDLLAKGVRFAATPVPGPANVIVTVAMSASANVAGECLIGRTARVLLPNSGGLLERLVRHVF
jgi:multidrug resistance efflux pump